MNLHLDNDSSMLPNDTLRYVLNGVFKQSGQLENENGNTLLNSLDNSDVETINGNIIGKIIIDNNRVVLFLDSNRIVEYNELTNTFGTLVSHNGLNFNYKYPIQGVYKFWKGCEDVIYWNDGLNPDRFYIMSRPEFHLDESNNFVLNSTNLIPLVPTFTSSVTKFGKANLEDGYYDYVLEFVDDFGNSIYKTPIQKIGFLNSSFKIKVNTDIKYNVKVYVLHDGNAYKADILNNEVLITDLNIMEQVDIGSVFIKINNFSVSNFMEISNKRLIRGNLKSDEEKYQSFREYAETIRPKLVAELSDDPCETLPSGEILDFGIVYIMENGNETPVFHIPNIENPEPIDSANCIIQDTYVEKNITLTWTPTGAEHTLTVGGGLSANYKITILQRDKTDYLLTTNNASTVQFQYNPKMPCYIIINGETSTEKGYFFEGYISPDITTIKVKKFTTKSTLNSNQYVAPTSLDIPGGVLESDFGPYFLNMTYSDPEIWCGDVGDFWKNSNGNTVSLYRTPQRSLAVPLKHEDKFVKLGVKFDEVNYPEGVVNHYFVYRSYNSVVDSGYTVNENLNLTPEHLIPEYQGLPLASYGSNRYLKYISPSVLINQEHSSDYLIPALRFDYSSKVDKDNTYDGLFEAALPYNEQLLTKTSIYDFNKATIIDHSFNTVKIHSENNTLPRDRSIKENDSFSNSVQFISVAEQISAGNVNYVYKYNFIDNNKMFKDYVTLSNIGENISFRGDTYLYDKELFNISELTFFSKTIDNYIEKTVDKVIKNEKLNNFVTAYVKINTKINPTLLLTRAIWTSAQNDDPINAYCQLYRGLSFESKVDFRLLKSIDNVSNYGSVTKLVASITEPYENKKKLKSEISSERYELKPQVVFEQQHFEFPKFYDYCSTCINCYPQRLVWSEISFAEQSIDNFRMYKPNNYIDLPGKRGPVRAFNEKDGKLIVRMTDGCFILPLSQPSIQFDNVSAYLGTGEFLSLPEQEYNPTELGYGGQTYKTSYINCEAGLFWADEADGSIYGFTNTIIKLDSNCGLWIKDSYRLFNIKHSMFKTYFTYDNYLKRLIIHRKVYEGVRVHNITSELIDGFVEFNGVDLITVRFPELINRSFTISYSFLSNGFISFHSYLPKEMFYLNNNFYTQSDVVDDYRIHKHTSISIDGTQQTNKNKYYGTQSDFIVETVKKESGPIGLQAVYFKTINNRNEENTFNKIWVYNQKESTGICDLSLDTYVPWSNTIKPVLYNSGFYKVNQLYSLIENLPISVRENYLDFYVDKTPNGLDLTMPLYIQSGLKDLYFNVRLIYTGDKELVYMTTFINSVKY